MPKRRLGSVLLAAALAAPCAMAADAAFVPAPGSPLQTDGTPGAIESGDLNGDGALDLIVTNRELERAEIFLGDNTGTFRKSDHSIPNKSGAIVLFDANGDNQPDIASAAENTYDVDIFLNAGSGAFTRATGAPFRMRVGDDARPWGIQAADINEDGHMDVFICNQVDGDVTGVIGDGMGGFTPMTAPIPVGADPFNLIMRDVNGDKHVDMVTPTSEGRIAEVSILYGDGKGAFIKGTPFVGAADPGWAAMGDINGDGHDDIATIQVEMPLICVGLGDGKGNFALAPGSPFPIASARYATEVQVADANGDGRADLFLAAGRNIQVLLANKNGEVSPAAGSPYAISQGNWRLEVGDWNNDGKADFASSNFGTTSIAVYLAR